MAYMDQKTKAKIADLLKKTMPKSWKYSLSVENHSGIRLTIFSADIDLIEIATARLKEKYNKKPQSMELTHQRLERHFSGELLEKFEQIVKALNVNNYNNSDSLQDYFDVAYYVTISIGRWDKPFLVKSNQNPEEAKQKNDADSNDKSFELEVTANEPEAERTDESKQLTKEESSVSIKNTGINSPVGC